LQKQGNAYLTEEDRALSPLERITAAAERLKGRRCCGGCDLARKNDLSAMCLLFPAKEEPEEGQYEALFYFWCPESDIERRSREHRVPYEAWRDAGLLTATPGDVTDFQFIQRDILALREKYQIHELGMDQALTEATSFVQPFKDASIDVCAHMQGYRLSEEIERVERLFIKHKICFHGNPIAAWNFANVSLTRNHIPRYSFDKDRSREKIDGAVALTMAYKSCKTLPDLSPYERRGIIFI
jgi:phage terminase large subunit-like protein